MRFQPRFGRYLAAAAENVVSILDAETQVCRHLLKVLFSHLLEVCMVIFFFLFLAKEYVIYNKLLVAILTGITLFCCHYYCHRVTQNPFFLYAGIHLESSWHR